MSDSGKSSDCDFARMCRHVFHIPVNVNFFHERLLSSGGTSRTCPPANSAQDELKRSLSRKPGKFSKECECCLSDRCEYDQTFQILISVF